MTRPTALLLDLDGTLLDTAPDMAGALNRLRTDEGLEPLPFESIRPHVSHGAARLVRLGFGEVVNGEFERLLKGFLDRYSARLADETRPFDGIEEILDELRREGRAWGVVTNKAGWLTSPLLSAMGLDRAAGCVISGDTLPERKPHPAPLLHAAHTLGLAPRECLYVGDAQRDIEAGRAAGMRTLVATWGYLGRDDRPDQWGADGLVDAPRGLRKWLHDGAAPDDGLHRG